MSFDQLWSPQFIILFIFLASAAFIHFRGRVRHKVLRQLTDHSTLLAPYNVLVYLTSAVPGTPMQDVRNFPELQPLEDHWQEIREEALRLMDEGHIRASPKYNDLAFNTFFKRGWKRFYIRWYDQIMPSARELCPKTSALVESIPSVNAALFAVLPPRSRLGEHRDPFAGSLRYHLGLKTPNSDLCRIYVDGEAYSWRDGQAVMFDETYIHSVENETDEWRVILFCDVARPIQNPVFRTINTWVTHNIVKVTATQNNEQEKIGALNYVSASIYKAKLFFTRLKEMNRTAYYTGKYAMMIGILYLLFFVAMRHR